MGAGISWAGSSYPEWGCAEKEFRTGKICCAFSVAIKKDIHEMVWFVLLERLRRAVYNKVRLRPSHKVTSP